MPFDECGGYDCMSGGFAIYDCDGNEVTTIDLRHFGQMSIDENAHESLAARAKAKAVADLIVESVNHATRQ